MIQPAAVEIGLTGRVIDRHLSRRRPERKILVSKTLPKISIGLPTYNRPDMLSEVLELFHRQTYSDFELIVSDNASPDPKVKRLCEHYAALDPRIRYVQHPINLGAEKNFWYVLDQASAPLFMWAADDDLWPLDFLEKGVTALEANPRASAWFCQVENIDIDGNVVRSYPSFKRFQSGTLKFTDLVRFLWEPEIMGKANLIYSIFRRQTLAEVIDTFRERPSTWGNDMNLVYGYLCRFNLVVDDQVVLRKRLATVTTAGAGKNPRSQIYPTEERATYFRNYRLAAAGSGYWLLTAAVLAARSPYDYLCSGRARQDYEFWRDRLFRVLARTGARLLRARK